MKLHQTIFRLKSYRLVLALAVAASSGVGAGHIFMNSVGSICIVRGPSMEPTYQPGARILTAPVPSVLERGDIVVLAEPNGAYALKRLVGLPGETIYLWHGHVYVNRLLLREPYLSKLIQTIPDIERGRAVFELGEDQYFVLGDNRGDSTDSRCFGPLERSQIKWRVPLPDNAPRPRLLAADFPNSGRKPPRLGHPGSGS